MVCACVCVARPQLHEVLAHLCESVGLLAHPCESVEPVRFRGPSQPSLRLANGAGTCSAFEGCIPGACVAGPHSHACMAAEGCILHACMAAEGCILSGPVTGSGVRAGMAAGGWFLSARVGEASVARAYPHGSRRLHLRSVPAWLALAHTCSRLQLAYGTLAAQLQPACRRPGVCSPACSPQCARMCVCAHAFGSMRGTGC